MSLKFPIRLAGKRAAAGGTPWDGFGNFSQAFSGLNSYADIGSSTASYNFIHEDKVFTVAAWVNLDNYTSSAIQSVFGNTFALAQRGFWLVYVGSVDQYALQITHGTAGQQDLLYMDDTITDNGWHHVCFTGDGSTIKAYLDGSLQTTTEAVTYTGSYGNANNNVEIGSAYNSVSRKYYMDGKICDVRVYDSDIGSAGVSDLAAGISFGSPESWWIQDTDDFDDYGDLGLNGTDNGATQDTDGPAD